MRILFAGKRHFDVGGVERSTHQLALRLLARGHAVAAVAEAPEETAQSVPRPALTEVPDLGYAAWGADGLAPAVAFREAKRLFRPDVVVVNGGGWWFHDWSLPLVGACAPTPSAFYIRDREAIRLLGEPGFVPDLVLANAADHARGAQEFGYRGTVIPSLIEGEDYRTPTTGDVVLYVNPSPSKGVRTALTLAACRPDIPFVFLESWQLPGHVLEELLGMASALGNVELVRAVPDPRSQYARARVLFAPYEDGNRPRVVAEAQLSGIPTLARDDPALREAVGPGGVLIDPNAGLEAWVAGLARLWDDPDEHRRLSAAALAHAARPEMDPDGIAERVEQALQRLVRLSRPADARELVSVILPVRDGAATIDRQLAALATQDHPGPWELVVSDNGSRDDTRARVLAWRDALPAELRVVDSSAHRGVAHARNVGIAASRGEQILICDADDEIEQGWIRRMVGALREHDIVTGAGDRAALNEPYQYEWMGLGKVTTRTEVGYGFLPYASGGNVGMRRTVAERLGGFDDSLRRAEDIDWSWRALYLGYDIHFVASAVVRYQMRSDLWSVAATRFRGGYVEPTLYGRHRPHGMPRAPLLEVLRDYRWLLARAGTATRDPEFRYSWLAMAAKRAGRIAGSIRHRTWFP